ncbi:MAG: SHOCT domain-containing protein [Patescibacteria group bacterium]
MNILNIFIPIAQAHSEDSLRGYHMLYPDMFGFSGFNFMILIWFLFIIGIVLIIAWYNKNKDNITLKADSALDILKERYAKGEIDKTEFEEKKKDLKN